MNSCWPQLYFVFTGISFFLSQVLSQEIWTQVKPIQKPHKPKEHACVPKRFYAEENESREPYRVCYYTTWARYRPPPFKMETADLNPHLCSHVIIAFAWIREAQMDLHSEWDDQGIFKDLVVWRSLFPHLKILAAVGGWNFGSEPFLRVIESAERRSLFVNSTIQFMEKWKMDGLDMDWEYPDWNERNNFTLLLKELRETYQSYSEETSKERFLLTAAVPAAEQRMGGYDVPEIQKYLDFINVMSYDLHGPWDKNTGHNAPLNSDDGLSVKKGVLMWVERGMPRGKVVVGMPTYGHSFRLAKPWTSPVGSTAWGGVSGPYTRTSGFYAYYEVCEFLNENGTNLHWDRLAGNVPYAVNEKIWISFDNEISLTKKVEWTLEEGLGGIMVWSLALDDFTGQICHENITYPLLRTLNLALGCDPSAEEERDQGFDLEKIKKKTEEAMKSKKTRKKAEGEEPAWKRTKEEKKTGVGSIWDKLTPQPPPTHPPPLSTEKCDFHGKFRPGKNCSHFVRCVRGKLHDFKCPPGLAYSPTALICLWPWEVKGCMKELGTHWPDNPDNPKATTTPQPQLEPPTPNPSETTYVGGPKNPEFVPVIPEIVHPGASAVIEQVNPPLPDSQHPTLTQPEHHSEREEEILRNRRIHAGGQYFDVPIQDWSSEAEKPTNERRSFLDLSQGLHVVYA